MKQKSDFRRLHEQEGCFLIPNPWDVGTVLSLASLGYSALATTSVGLAFALGQHAGQVSQKATLAHCRDLVAAPPPCQFRPILKKALATVRKAVRKPSKLQPQLVWWAGRLKIIPAKNRILFIRLIWRLRELVRPVWPATR